MKKILSALLAFIMLLNAFSVVGNAQKFMYDKSFVLGNADASEDNSINAMDLFAMKTYNLGREVAIDTNAADLAADGMINTQDMFYLKGMILGTVTAESLGDGNQTAKFAIDGVDISEFALVVPIGHDKTKNTHYAAEQLRKYVNETTGTYLAIVNDGTWTGPAINFFQHDRKSEMGIALGAEGYSYAVDEAGDLNIHGTYRGCMYAVYEILEQYLGVRFFNDEYTFLYKNRYVNIGGDVDVTVIPKMKFRYCGQNVRSSAENYYYPSRQNGTQIYSYGDERYGLQYGPQNINAHSFDKYWQMGTGIMPEDDGTMTLEQRYAYCESTGENINQFGWQPCGTSEAEYQILFTGMLRHMDRISNWGYGFNTTAKHLVEDGQKTMSFSLCDNNFYCSCRNCRNKANGWTDRKTGIYYPPEGYAGVYLDLANRAVNELQDYYPGMRVHMILYDKTIPATIRPDEKIVLMYCGLACQNHVINSGECINNGQLGNGNNIEEVEIIKAWGEMCAESGAELWYWNYAVTYHYYLVSLPCVFNIYYDYKYLYEECNVRGVYYEGGGRNYQFETVKAYLSTKMEWDPTMSLEQYEAYLKEYLYMYYGEGWNEIYSYLLMYEKAGDLCGTCFISNYDRPGDMLSYEYFAENYENMREILQTAYDKTTRSEQKLRIKYLMLGMEFMALSSVHTDWYTNGDEASKALYEERYTAWYNDMIAHDYTVYSSPGLDGFYQIPENCVFEVNPMVQIYEFGSRRPGVTP